MLGCQCWTQIHCICFFNIIMIAKVTSSQARDSMYRAIHTLWKIKLIQILTHPLNNFIGLRLGTIIITKNFLLADYRFLLETCYTFLLNICAAGFIMMQDNNPKQTLQVFKKYLKARKKTKKKNKRGIHTHLSSTQVKIYWDSELSWHHKSNHTGKRGFCTQAYLKRIM